MALFRSLSRRSLVPWILAGTLLLAITAMIVDTGNAQKGAKAPVTVKELLTPYVGYDTKLGKIKRLANEYVLIQEENAQTAIPYTAIQTIRFVKGSDPETTTVEIRLVAKD